MQNTPFFSIIIPTFNSQATIIRAVESVLSQTFRDFEILVIDGGSEDQTIDIIRHLSDSRVRIFVEKDRGIYDAMNKGIARSSGKWLYFLGSDDKLFDHTILDRVHVGLDDYVKLAYGRAFVTPDNFTTGKVTLFEDLMQYNICHQAIFYSATGMKEFFYDLKFPILADWDLNLKIFGRWPQAIKFLDIVVCEFNNTGVSSKWRHGQEYLKHFTRPVKVYWKYLPLLNAIKRITLYCLRPTRRQMALKQSLQTNRELK